jgi:hypothetical protein
MRKSLTLPGRFVAMQMQPEQRSIALFTMSNSTATRGWVVSLQFRNK